MRGKIECPPITKVRLNQLSMRGPAAKPRFKAEKGCAKPYNLVVGQDSSWKDYTVLSISLDLVVR